MSRNQLYPVSLVHLCKFVFYNFAADNDDHATAGVSEPQLKRARNVRNDDSLDPSAKWFPWRDKIVSTRVWVATYQE